MCMCLKLLLNLSALLGQQTALSIVDLALCSEIQISTLENAKQLLCSKHNKCDH